MGLVVKIPIEAAGQPFSEPMLEEIAQKLKRKRTMPGCSMPGRLACLSIEEHARLTVIEIWNAAHDAGDVDRAILEEPTAETPEDAWKRAYRVGWWHGTTATAATYGVRTVACAGELVDDRYRPPLPQERKP